MPIIHPTCSSVVYLMTFGESLLCITGLPTMYLPADVLCSSWLLVSTFSAFPACPTFTLYLQQCCAAHRVWSVASLHCCMRAIQQPTYSSFVQFHRGFGQLPLPLGLLHLWPEKLKQCPTECLTMCILHLPITRLVCCCICAVGSWPQQHP